MLTDNKFFRMIAPAFPAFNIYSRIASKTTALGPVSVATQISEMPDWQVEMIDENNYRHPGPTDENKLPDHNMLQEIKPADVVGLYGGLSSTIPRLLKLAALYRGKGVVTIAGGQHFIGENIKDGLDNGIDYIVLGEGEETIRELLDALAKNLPVDQIPGIAYLSKGKVIETTKRTQIKDFDKFPLPRFDLVRYADIRIFPVGWIRGCGMDCEFCTVKGKPRPASVQRVLRQFASVLEKHNGRKFFIVDDLFGHFRTETLRLCRMLADYQKATGSKFDITVQIRLDRARDSELLDAMRKARVNTVCIGFESPIPEELEAMNKKTKPEDMIELARLYHKAGFLVHGMFIFGYPTDTRTVLRIPFEKRIGHFLSFIRRSKLDTIQILLPVPLPGTELTQRLHKEGRIFDRKYIGWEYYDGNFPLFVPDKPMTPDQMHHAVKTLMSRFYRFRSMFFVGLDLMIFPSLVFSLWNLPYGWHKWRRGWRNNLVQFGGWIVMKRWKSAFSKGDFQERLSTAEKFTS
ncbi:MAG: B12-binding domain-containing radical SAM protein [Victivallales bacterium]|nr:B12-binding domain-containing radical SAM protein [Victivallales bacterium]